jgi:hypothetical protein
MSYDDEAEATAAGWVADVVIDSDWSAAAPAPSKNDVVIDTDWSAAAAAKARPSEREQSFQRDGNFNLRKFDFGGAKAKEEAPVSGARKRTGEFIKRTLGFADAKAAAAAAAAAAAPAKGAFTRTPGNFTLRKKHFGTSAAAPASDASAEERAFTRTPGAFTLRTFNFAKVGLHKLNEYA